METVKKITVLFFAILLVSTNFLISSCNKQSETMSQKQSKVSLIVDLVSFEKQFVNGKTESAISLGYDLPINFTFTDETPITDSAGNEREKVAVGDLVIVTYDYVDLNSYPLDLLNVSSIEIQN